jgi:peroxiredoxin
MRHVRSFAPRALVLCALALGLSGVAARAADAEYTGTLEPQLVANREDLDQIVFRPLRDASKVKFEKPLEEDVEVTAGRLYHPPQDKNSILTLLVESDDALPYVYADLNLDGVMGANERFEFGRGTDEDGEENPYVWEATLSLPAPGTPFATFPVFVQYLKGVQWEGLGEGERMIIQSKSALARGLVDVAGRKTLVQYGYNPKSKKISPVNGLVGIDGDGDGRIDMGKFSPEMAEAREENVVFRVGEQYVSTKKVDLEKNVVTLRSHPASDYKRVELRVGGEVPDFQFTDFRGKKRKLSEFRGKYLLLDFWGLWCPACRQELGYLKAAYSRFQARGFEILGMNTDDPEVASQLRGQLDKNGMTWTQATRESILDVIKSYRIHSYPTTMLVGPDGKIVSLSQTAKKQPSLRGRDLLRSLDQLLPP